MHAMHDISSTQDFAGSSAVIAWDEEVALNGSPGTFGTLETTTVGTGVGMHVLYMAWHACAIYGMAWHVRYSRDHHCRYRCDADDQQ